MTCLPARVRASDPGAALARRAARLLIARSRFDEADALVASSLEARPDDPMLLVTYAMTAHNRGLFEEAITRWQRALAHGADESFASACVAANLRTLGRHGEAQALIDKLLDNCPNDPMVLSEAARLAGDRHRPADALALWRRANQSHEPHPDELQGEAQSLVALGDLEGAKRVLRPARDRFPAHRGLLATDGAILVAREDWQAASAFWSEFRRRYPDDPTGWEQLGTIRQALAMTSIADRMADGPTLAHITVVEDEPMRQLVMRFESIGDSCEMGLVQRRFGAEPLGLLRWNDARLENLFDALAHRFEGMGEPANTELTTAINGEFFVKDRRWSLGMHTFVFAGHVDADDVFRKMCRRIVYLRDKLLEDLANADKVFVYRSPDVDVAGLRRLHAALQAFGPVRLLGAQPVTPGVTAFPGRPAGGVEKIDEDLYVGFLGRPGVDARGTWDIPFDDWTRIFSRTLAAIDAHVTA